MATTPDNVLQVIEKLEAADKEIVLNYIHKLEGLVEAMSSQNVDMADEMETTPVGEETATHDRSVDNDDDNAMDSDEAEFPPLYTSGEDFEASSTFKSDASDLMAEGKYEEALEKFTAAVLAAEPSPLLYANRATVLLKLDRPQAAERDCTEALKINPDSAKALRVRGKARKVLGKWEEALHDLSESQTIDFDEGTVDDLKIVTDKVHEMIEMKAHQRLEDEEKLKRKAEEIRKRKEEAKREAEEEKAAASSPRDFGGGMPGGMGGMPGGMPGGMGGMPGGMSGGMGGMPSGMSGIMQALLSDPELATSLQNPKVMAALSKLMSEPGGAMGLMSNPAKLQELLSDPEVGPVIQKLITKLGPAMGGFGGGAPPGATSAANNADDIPDLDNIPDPD